MFVAIKSLQLSNAVQKYGTNNFLIFFRKCARKTFLRIKNNCSVAVTLYFGGVFRI